MSWSAEKMEAQIGNSLSAWCTLRETQGTVGAQRRVSTQVREVGNALWRGQSAHPGSFHWAQFSAKKAFRPHQPMHTTSSQKNHTALSAPPVLSTSNGHVCLAVSLGMKFYVLNDRMNNSSYNSLLLIGNLQSTFTAITSLHYLPLLSLPIPCS